jgi:EAL domain-containing protein (putative c-di-GMP-specific phosphodiesterase class I)/GGDEF domain-containing protein
MLLPKQKEREYRFKLALRIGLPIFALVIALVSSTLITNYESLHASFYFESILLLAFSIYFIFYIIYNGFNEKITDYVSKTFTREYLLKYLKKEIQKHKEYTLILVSIENLHDINKLYGLKNGDKTLYEVANWIGNYLASENITKAPIGHLKGGDFIVGIEGTKEKYATIMEMMCIKASEFHIDNIEITISGAITDTNYSKDLNYLIENLFELQEIRKKEKSQYDDEKIDPNELEVLVIRALKNRNIVITSQDVYENDKVAFCECFTKLKLSNEKFIYPKRYKKIMNKLGLTLEFEKMLVEEVILHHSKFHIKRFAINISASSLRNESFLSFIKQLLHENKEHYEKIIFIVCEQEYYSYKGRFNTIINSLKSLNVFVAIDRIGSYHTSFLYLRELDIAMVRFDSYYSNEEKMQEQRGIIEGFNVIAKQKGIKTWIKNLETQNTLTLAEELNIDFLQGKYLAKLEKKYEN